MQSLAIPIAFGSDPPFPAKNAIQELLAAIHEAYDAIKDLPSFALRFIRLHHDFKPMSNGYKYLMNKLAGEFKIALIKEICFRLIRPMALDSLLYPTCTQQLCLRSHTCVWVPNAKI